MTIVTKINQDLPSRPQEPHFSLLQRCTANDFLLLCSWLQDPDLLFQTCGTDFVYPLTEPQITEYQRQHPERRFYLGILPSHEPFAFGEIIPQGNNIVRLGRLLIGNPARRGQGLGEAFVRELLQESAEQFRAHLVDLYVLEDNAAAIRCYSKVGFTFTDEEAILLYHDGEPRWVRKMHLMVREAN